MNLLGWFKPTAVRSVPVLQPAQEKVFLAAEQFGYEYSFMPPAHVASLLDGFYGRQNLIELFYALPEIFAPINEIASRVADAVWQLRKDWNDEVDYKDADFNRLFTQPNPVTAFKDMIYQAVCYEILTGRQFWYKNQPDTLPDEYRSVLSWFNLPAQDVIVEMQQDFDVYSTTTIEDFVQRYKIPLGGYNNWRYFESNRVTHVIHLSLQKAYNLNTPKPILLGAEKAIANLIPVYQARGIIYIKRGALGLFVNRAKDTAGNIPMTDEERLETIKAQNADYGITAGKQPIGVTGANIDFLRTSMSIQELQPFDETLADAVAIYRVLRVPRHLVPSKDTSTFANADADLKSFYTDVIIPWAQRYAEVFTNWFKIPRRYIYASFDHIAILQENKKESADVDATATATAITQYKEGVITRNQLLAKLGQNSTPDGDTYISDTNGVNSLAVLLGGHGVTALEQFLLSPLPPDVKRNSLTILFGISEEDAAKMVTNETITPTPPSVETAGSTNQLPKP